MSQRLTAACLCDSRAVLAKHTGSRARNALHTASFASLVHRRRRRKLNLPGVPACLRAVGPITDQSRETRLWRNMAEEFAEPDAAGEEELDAQAGGATAADDISAQQAVRGTASFKHAHRQPCNMNTASTYSSASRSWKQ